MALSYPCYFMHKDTQHLWRWPYYAVNGKIIGVSSESYHNKADCLHSVNIMKGSGNSTVFEQTT